MFKLIWQVTFPLSVAFFAAFAFEDSKVIAITGGAFCLIAGIYSYQLDRKEEEEASYKRLNYFVKRLRQVLAKERELFVAEMKKVQKDGGKDE